MEKITRAMVILAILITMVTTFAATVSPIVTDIKELYDDDITTHMNRQMNGDGRVYYGPFDPRGIGLILMESFSPYGWNTTMATFTATFTGVVILILTFRFIKIIVGG